MHGIRVSALIGMSTGVGRAILTGLHDYAAEKGWMLLQVDPESRLSDMFWEWEPDALVISSQFELPRRKDLPVKHVVSLGEDRTAMGIASVCLDEELAGRLAAEHLLDAGLRQFSAFGFVDAGFYQRRKRGFRERVEQEGGTFLDTGDFEGTPGGRSAFSLNIVPWLRTLPRPCGILAGCDGWARQLSPYIPRAGLRMPEDVALVGVDNDYLNCELASPPISSVAIPWMQMGHLVGELLERSLKGRPSLKKPVMLKPVEVVRRRSSDYLAVKDELVAETIRVIHELAVRPIGVGDILRRVPAYRHRLERAFRRHLGRTIMDEVRRAHVELARRWLSTTLLPMPEVARRSGFSNATLMGIAFRRETGMTPSVYRRMMRESAGQA